MFDLIWFWDQINELNKIAQNAPFRTFSEVIFHFLKKTLATIFVWRPRIRWGRFWLLPSLPCQNQNLHSVNRLIMLQNKVGICSVGWRRTAVPEAKGALTKRPYGPRQQDVLIISSAQPALRVDFATPISSHNNAIYFHNSPLVSYNFTLCFCV